MPFLSVRKFKLISSDDNFWFKNDADTDFGFITLNSCIPHAFSAGVLHGLSQD